MAENAKYMDSIAGKSEQLTNAMQNLWNNAINSDVIKFFLDLALGITETVDTIGLLPSALAGVLFYLTALKNNNPVMMFKELSANMYNTGVAANQIKTIQSLNFNAQGKQISTWQDFNAQNINAYALAVKDLTAAKQAQTLASAGLTQTQIKEAMSANGVSEANIQQALSETKVAAAKTKSVAVSGSLILADQKRSSIKLSTTAQNWLEAHSEEAITTKLLAQAVAKNQLSHKDAVAILQSRRLTQENIKQNASWKGLTTSIKDMIAQNPVMFFMMLGTAITSLIDKIETATDRTEKLTESYNELQSGISTLESNISSTESELENIQYQIDELQGKDSLSLADAEQLALLQSQSEELTNQKELYESLLSARAGQNQAKSLSMINNLLETTAANQQAAAESGAEWGKVLGTVAGVLVGIAGVALAPFTGGGSLVTVGLGASLAGAGTAALGAGIAGGMIGSSLGSMAGEAIGSNSKAVGNSLIEWYESYEEAIADAEQKASKAEAEYFSDMSDSNYDKWQEKVKQVSTLQEEMSNGLEEMQSYISNLEYNDQTANIINGYNNLITHLDIKSNEGNIDGQISSLEALTSEYYELSKGVDESGKNVALSAEEYTRYCSIVEQVIAYTPSLVQGYDAEGNAILERNTLLADSIALLREQQRLAAYAITYGENGQDEKKIINAYESIQKNHTNALKTVYDIKPEGGFNNIGGSNWRGHEIEDVIGVNFDWYYNLSEYIANNADLVYQNLDKILEKAKSELSEEEFQAYESYLNNIITQLQSIDTVATQFKSTLYTIPQASEYYYDLSGESLDFINNYINSYVDSIENIENLKELEITTIRDNIKSLTDEIGYNKEAQELIGDMFAINANSIPVDTYKKEISSIYDKLLLVAPEIQNELKAMGIIDQETWFAMVVPTDETIQNMKTEVGAKMKDGLSGLVGSLSLPELQIAFKHRAELDDGANYSDLIQLVEKYSEEVSGPIVQTYSELKEQASKFNDVITQTNEIILNNTEVTQEYKDSLIELGVSEEDLAECFDATNPLVVKNTARLKQLVKTARQSAVSNIALARSQAVLQYHQKVMEINAAIDAEDKLTGSTLEHVDAMQAEADELEKAIAQYSVLETAISGATDGYEEFKKAQETDEETDYIGNIEEMTLALGEAFQTGELGTETAQAAIKALVPESVYEDLDTVDEKMDAIYKYFKKGKLSMYLDVQYNDDGDIEGAEMKLGNLRKFIEDGLNEDYDEDGIKVFSGEDWQHFELSDDFIASIEDAEDPLQEFADQMGVTKEVAFAFVEALRDHDIEWLNGDYSNLTELLIPDTLEGKLLSATQKVSEYDEAIKKLDEQYAKGEFAGREAEYTVKRTELIEKKTIAEGKQVKAKEASRQNMFGDDGTADQNFSDADGYLEANLAVVDAQEKVTGATKNLTDAQTDYNEAKANGASDEELKTYENAILSATDNLEAQMVVLNEATAKRNEFATPTTAELTIAIADIEQQIKDAGDKFDKGLVDYFGLDEKGYWTLNANVDTTTLEQEYPGILKYVGLLNSKTMINAYLNGDEAEADANALQQTVDGVIEAIEQNLITLDLDEEAVRNLAEQANKLLGEITRQIGVSITASLPSWMQSILGWMGFDTDSSDTTIITDDSNTTPSSATGPGKVNGTAHSSGNWGLPTSEHDSLVGELGPEMIVNPYTGRYYTVGDNGAEMVDLPKGAIIFNHKQTEGLLKNGHITSRGKAYAEGNAHVTIYGKHSAKSQWDGTGYSGPNDSTYDLSDAFDDVSDSTSDAADSASEFAETFDWIEVRLEEINEDLDLMNAKLENTVGFTNQNNLIDNMIDLNKTKLNNLTAGIKKYSDYAARLLADVPAQYREAAQDGSIAITEFAGEADEKTVEAINNYREWADKVADLKQQFEETNTEIAQLAKQKFDNIAEAFDNKTGIRDHKIQKLEDSVSLDEEQGEITSPKYYRKMINHTTKKRDTYINERNRLQTSLDESVANGDIKKYSSEWYEMVDAIYEVDHNIDECTLSLEEFQNAINELHWENFEEFIDRLENVQDETGSMIDLLSNVNDAIDKPEDAEYWGADDVEWSNEGLASLGLYAQQMENARYEAQQYGLQIQQLNKAYENGKYSENEYREKLAELTSSQNDAIDSYYEAKDAIVELNEARIDAIKEGIEKEIEAYEELIEKKKEELDSEKDLYDFQKRSMEQEKNISDIKRKLAALAGDNSASAIAQKKRLESELAEAEAEQEELYYERSIENQQNALDKELENFQEGKDAEIEAWEQYLEDENQVVAESFEKIKANASTILETLNQVATDHGIVLSDTITSPWEKGVNAIGEYSAAVDELYTKDSAYTKGLKGIKADWKQDKKDQNTEAQTEINDQKAENKKTTAGTKQKPKKKTTSNNKNSNKSSSSSSKAAPSVGNTVTVKKSATHFSSKSGNAKMASFVPGGSYTVYQVSGDQILIGRSGVYTGWVKKTDLNGYAKGSLGVDKDQLALIDELGEELQLVPGTHGRLEYIKKGTGIVPADLTERLMNLAMNPQNVLDQNRPQITPHNSIINNNMEFKIDASVGELIHVEHLDGGNPNEINKIIDKAWDKKMQGLNNAIKKFSR